MAKRALGGSLRDWFIALSTPAKALVFVVLACLTALGVVGIVVSGSPNRGGSSMLLGDGAVSGSSDSSGAASGAAPASSPLLTSSSSSTSGSAAVAGAAGSAAGKTTSQSSTDPKPSGKTSGNSGASGEGTETTGPTTPPVLTAELRKKIAAELIDAEKRAEQEAAAKYPVDPKAGGTASNSAKYGQLRSDLIDAYTAAVVKKYGLTTEQTIDILIVDAALQD